MLPDLPKIYRYLAILRIILICIPQTGYIHPDEFFQSIEIYVGKVFEVEYSPPWEFNVTFPIRSMILPYFTIGMSYRLLYTLNYFLPLFADYSVITPYALLIAPRLLIGFLSFLVDFCIYKICVNNNEKYKTKLVVLGSSYVMLIYGTRTFSNTLELILFGLLLYYVCESLIFSNILLKKKEYINYRYNNSRNVVEKAKFHKLRLYLTSDSLRNCFEISTIVVLGFFNRPTFLAYALFPVFFWLYRGLGSKVFQPIYYHLRLIMLMIASLPMLILSIIVDSFFYAYLTWGEIGVGAITIDNFVFTPLNFIKYNINTANLSKHGLHPRYLHILINVPLLFNILGLLALFGCCENAYNFLKGKHHLLPTVRSIKGLMTLSFLAPICFLSIFPHQEPRFLIPIVIPLVYLYGNILLPELDTGLMKSQEMALMQHKSKTIQPSKVLLKLWIIFNVILTIFYGFIHQGGIYPATNYLSNDMKHKLNINEYHIVTSHIYSLPESFLLQKSTEKLYFAKGKPYSVNKRTFLYEEGSLDLEQLLDKIQGIVDRNRQIAQLKRKHSKVFLVIPGSLSDRLVELNVYKNLTIFEIESFYPHLSTEAFPDLLGDILYVFNDWKIDNFLYLLQKICTSFSLKLYEIKYTS